MILSYSFKWIDKRELHVICHDPRNSIFYLIIIVGIKVLLSLVKGCTGGGI